MCGVYPPVKVPWSNSKCEHPLLSLSLPHWFTLPLPPPITPPPSPTLLRVFHFLFWWKNPKQRQGGGHLTSVDRRLYLAVYVCFIKPVKQSTQHKQHSMYTLLAMHTRKHRHALTLPFTVSPSQTCQHNTNTRFSLFYCTRMASQHFLTLTCFMPFPPWFYTHMLIFPRETFWTRQKGFLWLRLNSHLQNVMRS